MEKVDLVLVGGHGMELDRVPLERSATPRIVRARCSPQ